MRSSCILVWAAHGLLAASLYLAAVLLADYFPHAKKGRFEIPRASQSDWVQVPAAPVSSSQPTAEADPSTQKRVSQASAEPLSLIDFSDPEDTGFALVN